MPRRVIDAKTKVAALAACEKSLKEAGKPQFEKNAEAAGVTPATLRAWWKKEHGGKTPRKRRGGKAAKRGRPAGRAKKAARAVRAAPGRVTSLEKSIDRIEAELKAIRGLFSEYRDSLIRKLREGV